MWPRRTAQRLVVAETGLTARVGRALRYRKVSILLPVTAAVAAASLTTERATLGGPLRGRQSRWRLSMTGVRIATGRVWTSWRLSGRATAPFPLLGALGVIIWCQMRLGAGVRLDALPRPAAGNVVAARRLARRRAVVGPAEAAPAVAAAKLATFRTGLWR